MQKVLNNPWVVGALVCVALASVYWRVTEKPDYEFPPVDESLHLDQPVARVEPSDHAPEPQPPSMLSERIDDSVSHLAGEWLETAIRDPFRTVRGGRLEATTAEDRENRDDDAEAAVRTLRLQAVSVQGSQRLAVINHGVYAVGDRVADAKILKIDSSGIIVRTPQGEQYLGFDEKLSPSHARDEDDEEAGNEDLSS